jgi:hypothetical protein
MPSLTPQELQEARRRSGRLGGRPPKPSREEARAAALEQLVPPAIAALRAHLGEGDPGAWRAGLKVLELAYGPAPAQQQEDVVLPEGAAEVAALSWRDLQVVAARLLGELPAGETVNGTINAMPLAITDGAVG